MTTLAQQFMAKANASQYYDPNDPLTPVYANLVATYSNESQFKGTARGNAALIEGCLRARMILYWKKTPGDCGITTKISVGPGGTIAKGLGTASTLAGGLGSILAGPFALGVLPFTIWGIISAHHAQAVAKEQATLCDVIVAVNSGFISIRDANIDWASKKKYFNDLTAQALSGAAGVTQKSTGTCNAGCMIGNAILALRDLYILLYAQPPNSQVLDGVGSATTTQQRGPTATNSQGGAIVSNPAISLAEAGGAAALAHYAGLF